MAFTVGAELWLVPDVGHSHWTRKIDWYLNFQMLRASAHSAPVVAPQLLELLKDEGLAAPTASSQLLAPLMISTAHRLPARYAVHLPYQGNLRDWLKRVAQIWHHMRHPSTRLFLPTGVNFSECQAAWGEPDSQNVSVVMDSDHQKTTGH